MMSNPLLLWTRNGVVVMNPLPQGPFANSEAAIGFAQAFYQGSLPGSALRLDLGGANGFLLVPAENFVFSPDGKAVAKSLQS